MSWSAIRFPRGTDIEEQNTSTGYEASHELASLLSLSGHHLPFTLCSSNINPCYITGTNTIEPTSWLTLKNYSFWEYFLSQTRSIPISLKHLQGTTDIVLLSISIQSP